MSEYTEVEQPFLQQFTGGLQAMVSTVCIPTQERGNEIMHGLLTGKVPVTIVEHEAINA